MASNTSLNTTTTVNMSELPYDASGVSSFQDLFMRSNEFMGGGLGLGLLFVVWGISYYQLNDFPVRDSVTASTWVTFLTSALLSLINVIEPAFAVLLLILTLALTGYNYSQNN